MAYYPNRAFLLISFITGAPLIEWDFNQISFFRGCQVVPNRLEIMETNNFDIVERSILSVDWISEQAENWIRTGRLGLVEENSFFLIPLPLVKLGQTTCFFALLHVVCFDSTTPIIRIMIIPISDQSCISVPNHVNLSPFTIRQTQIEMPRYDVVNQKHIAGGLLFESFCRAYKEHPVFPLPELKITQSESNERMRVVFRHILPNANPTVLSILSTLSDFCQSNDPTAIDSLPGVYLSLTRRALLINVCLCFSNASTIEARTQDLDRFLETTDIVECSEIDEPLRRQTLLIAQSENLLQYYQYLLVRPKMGRTPIYAVNREIARQMYCLNMLCDFKIRSPKSILNRSRRSHKRTRNAFGQFTEQV